MNWFLLHLATTTEVSVSTAHYVSYSAECREDWIMLTGVVIFNPEYYFIKDFQHTSLVFHTLKVTHGSWVSLEKYLLIIHYPPKSNASSIALLVICCISYHYLDDSEWYLLDKAVVDDRVEGLACVVRDSSRLLHLLHQCGQVRRHVWQRRGRHLRTRLSVPTLLRVWCYRTCTTYVSISCLRTIKPSKRYFINMMFSHDVN